MILPVLLQSSKIRLLDKYELIAIVCCSNVCYMQKLTSYINNKLINV